MDVLSTVVVWSCSDHGLEMLFYSILLFWLHDLGLCLDCGGFSYTVSFFLTFYYSAGTARVASPECAKWEAQSEQKEKKGKQVWVFVDHWRRYPLLFCSMLQYCFSIISEGVYYTLLAFWLACSTHFAFLCVMWGRSRREIDGVHLQRS